jgi:hypothetical protein
MSDQPSGEGRVQPTDPNTRAVHSTPSPRVKTTDRPIREDVRRAIARDRQRAVDPRKK